VVVVESRIGVAKPAAGLMLVEAAVLTTKPGAARWDNSADTSEAIVPAETKWCDGPDVPRSVRGEYAASGVGTMKRKVITTARVAANHNRRDSLSGDDTPCMR
jgi:hypothetical protein